MSDKKTPETAEQKREREQAEQAEQERLAGQSKAWPPKTLEQKTPRADGAK